MTDEHASRPGAIIEVLTRLVSCHDLPEAAPDDPMPLLLAWYAEAERSGRYDDFNAMTLATATDDGAPSARIVLCKSVETSPPALVFYTSYASHKSCELEANPRAAAVFHWPHAKRQVRVEGRAERVSDAESDAYFRSRPLLSRVGACVSRQSAPLESRATLVGEAIRTARRAVASGTLARPADWGGYRLLIRAIELWSAREGRLHDRIRWTRRDDGGDGGDDHPRWTAQRLSP